MKTTNCGYLAARNAKRMKSEMCAGSRQIGTTRTMQHKTRKYIDSAGTSDAARPNDVITGLRVEGLDNA